MGRPGRFLSFFFYIYVKTISQGSSWGVLGPSWGRLDRFLRRIGAVLGVILEVLKAVLGGALLLALGASGSPYLGRMAKGFQRKPGAHFRITVRTVTTCGNQVFDFLASGNSLSQEGKQK